METVYSERQGLHWLWLSFIIIITDQFAKHLVTGWLSYAQSVNLLSFLSLTLAYNKGAAFSFLSEQGRLAIWFFVTTACGISFFLCMWMYRLRSKNNWLRTSLALILGGAIGNLVDRIYYGYVIDFIHFHVGNWSFPIFNIADTAITIGALMLILDIFRKKQL